MTTGISVNNPVGKIELIDSGEKLEGVYDRQSFQWLTGPGKDKGVHLAENNNIREIFSEGLFGFQPHKLELCKPNQVKKVTLPAWVLEKEKGQWNILEKNKKDRARPDQVNTILEKICDIAVDTFATSAEPGTSTDALKIDSGSKEVVIKKFINTFLQVGGPYFESHSLTETLSLIRSDDLRDPTLDEAKIALDRRQPQDERIKAIRKLRGNNSPQAIAALRDIIFEPTDIDLYRYEAVDTLQETNTKQGWKVIIDRLPQVGRTGFELRMARALAGAMGTFFKADEKTPEEVRRPEVDNLVEMAKKKPPGK